MAGAIYLVTDGMDSDGDEYFLNKREACRAAMTCARDTQDEHQVIAITIRNDLAPRELIRRVLSRQGWAYEQKVIATFGDPNA